VQFAYGNYCVYLASQEGLPRRDPFLEIALENDGLVITVEARQSPLRLTLEDWEEILDVARKYQKRILEGNDKAPPDSA
jgi:hypothetical protein